MKKAKAKRSSKPANASAPRRRTGAGAPTKLERALDKAAKLIAAGRSGEALALIDPLTVEHPDCAKVWALKGRAHSNFRDQMLDACAALEAASELQPDDFTTLLGLGRARRNAGQHLLACKAFLQAQQLAPDNVMAVGNLAVMFSQLGDAAAAVELYRPMIDRDQDLYSTHLMIANYVDHLSAQDLADAALTWGRKVEAAATPLAPARPAPAAGQRLRIGYLSADLREHSIMRYLLPLLEHHDPARVEPVCYYNGLVEREDEMTDRIRANSAAFTRVRQLSDRALAKQIRADGIDVLVEMSGHTAGNRLTALALRPAPVQVSWLGYPNTTGLSAIDYRISDWVVDPAGMFDQLSSETIARMDGGFHCFRSVDGTPEVAPLPALKQGHITFGSYNNLSKVTPTTLDLWSRVLGAVQDSKLLIKSNTLVDPHVCERLRGEFADRGINGSRLILSGWMNDQRVHLGTYANVDIALDAYPYNGTTTTCEALWMGVPTITLCGDTPASRVSASLLTQVGLEPLIAHDAETFVLNAAELASDVDRLANLRSQLRPAMAGSTLGDEPGFARRFETTLAELFDRKRAWTPADAEPRVAAEAAS
jgi:predicted O-linked N-acetylglucosamine transferase (SPINDLY family)